MKDVKGIFESLWVVNKKLYKFLENYIYQNL